MSDEKEELLPCPFCGSSAWVIGEETFFVECSKCYCAMGEAYDVFAMTDHKFLSASEAIAAWNTRA